MLPDTLDLPVRVASTLRFDTYSSPYDADEHELFDSDPDVLIADPFARRHDLTARDRALLLVVSWYASRHPELCDEQGCRIPDRPMRQAMGLRTLRDEWEDARFDRFARSRFLSDDLFADGAPVPTMVKGMRRRTLAGHHLWDVDEQIRSAFAIKPGDIVVDLDSRLLAEARSRYTMTLMLRMLAWGAGARPSKWLRWEKDDHAVLRIPEREFRTALGIGDRVRPSELMRDMLMPALAEIHQHTNLPVDLQAWQGPSLKKNGKGRLMGYDVIVPINGRTVPQPTPTHPTAEVIALHDRPIGRSDPALDAEDEDLGF